MRVIDATCDGQRADGTLKTLSGPGKPTAPNRDDSWGYLTQSESWCSDGMRYRYLFA